MDLSLAQSVLQRLPCVKVLSRDYTLNDSGTASSPDTETGLAKLLTVKLEWTAAAESD